MPNPAPRTAARSAAGEHLERQNHQLPAVARRSRQLAITALLAAPLAAATTPAFAAESETPQPRLLVADGVGNKIRIFETTTKRGPIRTLRVSGPASLTVAGDDRHVLAAQPAASRVDAIDAGTETEQHGDHAHYHLTKPKLLPFAFAATKPALVVPHGDAVTIFADGTGQASTFALSALSKPAKALSTISVSRAHHGVAVAIEDRVIVSQPAEGAASSLPGLLQITGRDGSPVGAPIACPELHGETSGDGWAAFACETGIEVISIPGAGQQPTSELLPYPAGATAERRAWTLRTINDGAAILGGFGDRALFTIDRKTKSTKVIDAPADIASFAADHDSALLALTTDGQLRRFSASTGKQTASRRVVRGSFAASHGKPAPKLTVSGDLVAVSDPAARRVTVVSSSKLRVVRKLTVPGAPTSIAITGTGEAGHGH